MKTEETNKLIAEFLGWETLSNWGYLNINNGESHEIENLKFHSDWNWLMEVVEKIESLGYLVEIRENVCFIKTSEQDYFSELEETKLQAVYRACVKFIKWYNEQK